MRKLYFFIAFVGLALIHACTDHEVIPPPVPLVDLNCDCEMDVADSVNKVKYTDSCKYETDKIISTGGGVSTARYKTRIKNEGVIGGLELEIRSINWVDDGTNNPPLDAWKAFLSDNPTPSYSGGIEHHGVVVRWTDPNGRVWESDSTETVCVKDFVFNTMIHETDTTGTYMQFDATFNCSVFNSDYGVIDSLKCIENAHFRSAFKLE